MSETAAWIGAVVLFGLTVYSVLLDIRMDAEPQYLHYHGSHVATEWDSIPADCWDIMECEGGPK